MRVLLLSPAVSVVVVVRMLISRPAWIDRLSRASIVAPMLFRSVLASRATLPPLMRPPRLSMVSALIDTSVRPAMLPLFVTLPSLLILTASALSKPPEPSMSPGRTRTYTCGTSTRWVLPSGKVTVCSTNLDHYVDCFWLVGLALALDVPDEQWQRLLVLIGNEGEDLLLDRIIATRSPRRKIGASLCYPKPYVRLLEAIDAPEERQALQLKQFVERWYQETGGAARSGREAQAIAFKAPYWHNYHRIKGAYFGYWCLEAVAAVKAFNLDDSLCVGHPHYPGDLLRPGQVTAPDPSRLLPELAATIGAPPEPPFTGEPRHLTKWEAFKLLVKNKLNS